MPVAKRLSRLAAAGNHAMIRGKPLRLRSLFFNGHAAPPGSQLGRHDVTLPARCNACPIRVSIFRAKKDLFRISRNGVAIMVGYRSGVDRRRCLNGGEQRDIARNWNIMPFAPWYQTSYRPGIRLNSARRRMVTFHFRAASAPDSGSDTTRLGIFSADEPLHVWPHPNGAEPPSRTHV